MAASGRVRRASWRHQMCSC